MRRTSAREAVATSAFALFDTDALQRACTLDAVGRLGYDCTVFASLGELARALQSGRDFDVVGVALHPGQSWTAEDLRLLKPRGEGAHKLVLMAHHTELAATRTLLLQVLREGPAQFIATPVEEEELRLRLQMLEPSQHFTAGARWASAA